MFKTCEQLVKRPAEKPVGELAQLFQSQVHHPRQTAGFPHFSHYSTTYTPLPPTALYTTKNTRFTLFSAPFSALSTLPTMTTTYLYKLVIQ